MIKVICHQTWGLIDGDNMRDMNIEFEPLEMLATYKLSQIKHLKVDHM